MVGCEHKGGAGGGVQLPPASLGTPSLPRAFYYTKKYCQDICFDNLYITTYFRQIDARRKKQVRGEMGQGFPPTQGSPPPPGPPRPLQGCTEPPCSPLSQNKRTLLPLRRAEIPTVIFPCRLAMQPRELQSVVRGWGGCWGSGVGVLGAGRGGPRSLQVLELLECIPPLLLLLLAWGLDHTLYTMLSIIHQHSFVQYSFRSETRPRSPRGAAPSPTAPWQSLYHSPCLPPQPPALPHSPHVPLFPRRQPPLVRARDGHVPDGSAPAEHHRVPEHLL